MVLSLSTAVTFIVTSTTTTTTAAAAITTNVTTTTATTATTTTTTATTTTTNTTIAITTIATTTTAVILNPAAISFTIDLVPTDPHLVTCADRMPCALFVFQGSSLLTVLLSFTFISIGYLLIPSPSFHSTIPR